jgi:hypothetical protein
MITADPTAFPSNIVSAIKTRAQTLDADLYVVRRPLRDSDPPQSIGVAASLWNPEDDSLEMKGVPIGRQEPTLQRYRITIQSFVKNMDEEAGISEHATLSKMVRGMLYRDETLRIQLASLVWTDGVTTERSKRWGVINQRFVSNEIRGVWLFLSVLEFWLETETV